MAFVEDSKVGHKERGTVCVCVFVCGRSCGLGAQMRSRNWNRDRNILASLTLPSGLQ